MALPPGTQVRLTRHASSQREASYYWATHHLPVSSLTADVGSKLISLLNYSSDLLQVLSDVLPIDGDPLQDVCVGGYCCCVRCAAAAVAAAGYCRFLSAVSAPRHYEPPMAAGRPAICLYLPGSSQHS